MATAADLIQGVASNLVTSIQLSTNVLPTLTFNQPFTPGAAAPAPVTSTASPFQFLLAIFQPVLTVSLPAGQSVSFAPGGVPSGSGLGQAIGLGLLGFLGLSLVEGVVKRWKIALGLGAAAAVFVLTQSQSQGAAPAVTSQGSVTSLLSAL